MNNQEKNVGVSLFILGGLIFDFLKKTDNYFQALKKEPPKTMQKVVISVIKKHTENS